MILRNWKFPNRPTWLQPLCFPRVSAIWDIFTPSIFSETLIFPRKYQWFWENGSSQIVTHGSNPYVFLGFLPSGTFCEHPFSSISSESLDFPSENQRFWENGCSQNVPHGTNPRQPLSCKRLAPSGTFWLFHHFAKCRNMLVKHNVFCHVKPHVF